MAEFQFFWPTRFLFGRGEIEKAGGEAKKLGRRALLVVGRSSMRRTGILDRVMENVRNSGVDVVLHEGVGPNPRSGPIDEIGELAKREGCEFVIGLGGGSVMDAAKGIAIAATHPGSVWEYINSFSEFCEVTGATLPVMEIPTVAGTGSEGNGTTVISNEKTREKSFIKSDFLFPRISIIDPELTLSVTPEMTAETGVDIVCHVLEPYLTRSTGFSASVRITEAIMRAVAENLPAAVADGANYGARENLAWSATLACSPLRGLGLSGAGSLHHIEHTVSGWFDVSHGGGLCALLPSWLKYLSGDLGERLEQFGLEVFGSRDGIGAIEDWLRKVGADRTLADMGVDRKACRQMALDTIRVYGRGEKSIPSGSRRLFVEDIVNIYEDAF
jgi:alcohol dehydrogenase YqhD (iron-dependent ADH family)